MAGRERDWMDYAQLASSAAQNAQLSSLGDQLAALKKAESQKQFADFEVTVIRQILFRIEDRIRVFTKQASLSPQGKMLALMKMTEVLASFNDPSFYRHYEDKDRHTALTSKVEEAAMEIARSVPPAELAEFNEAVAWQKKLPLLAKAMQLNRESEEYLKQMEDRPRLEAEHLTQQAMWQAALDALQPQLAPLHLELQSINAQLPASAQLIAGMEAPAAPLKLSGIEKFGGGCLLYCVGSLIIGGLAALHWVLGAVALLFLVIFVPFALNTEHKHNKLRQRGLPLLDRIGKITATLDAPSELLPLPRKPADESCERFLLKEKVGSTFQELEATFTEKRALVERVLEADKSLEKDLIELEAPTLLHRTAQETATKMGLPLPPQLASGASA